MFFCERERNSEWKKKIQIYEKKNKYPVGRTFTEKMSFSDSQHKPCQRSENKGVEKKSIDWRKKEEKKKICDTESGVYYISLIIV